MIDFNDRAPTIANRKKITKEDGTVEYVTIENADEPIETGTPLNRQKLMALQGFIASTTVFNNDGSIVQTNAEGHTLITTFPSKNQIIETFSGEKFTITKTTTFNTDGSIAEVIS